MDLFEKAKQLNRRVGLNEAVAEAGIVGALEAAGADTSNVLEGVNAAGHKFAKAHELPSVSLPVGEINDQAAQRLNGILPSLPAGETIVNGLSRADRALRRLIQERQSHP